MKRHASTSLPDEEAYNERHKRLLPPSRGQSRNASPSSREYTPYNDRPSNASTPLPSLEQLGLGKYKSSSLQIGLDDRPQSKNEELDSVEVCFGMLCCKVERAQANVLSGCKVDVSTGQIRSQSAERVGELEKPVAKVLKELSVHEGFSLQTYVHYAVPRSSDASDRRPSKRAFVHAIVYGPLKYFELLGTALDESRIYLQDPLACDRNVQYRNPHRLVDSSDRTRMTSEYNVVEDGEYDVYGEEADILAELESTEELRESDTPAALQTALFSHQKQALTFMRRREKGWTLNPPGNDVDIWARVQEGEGYLNNITNEHTLERPSEFRGGILADTMGLGKSLTSIACIASDLDDARHRTMLKASSVRATLLIVKPSLLGTWKAQFAEHVKPGQIDVRTHHRNQKLASSADLADADVVITTYNTVLSEWKRQKSSHGRPGIVYSIRWWRIMLDEGHEIRAHKSLTHVAICALESERRWAITATPIQNRLLDFASLLAFLRMEPYDTLTAFQSLSNRLLDEYHQDGAKSRLRQMVRCVMLRRTQTAVELPPRNDNIVRLNFSEEEAALYEELKQQTLGRSATLNDAENAHSSTLQLFTILRMICNLGLLYRKDIDNRQRDKSTVWDRRTAQDLFRNCIASGLSNCHSCSVDVSDATTQSADEDVGDAPSQFISPCGHLLCSACRANDVTCSCTSCSGPPIQVSLLNNSAPGRNDVVEHLHIIPTKIKAVLKDLEAHVANEKCIVLSFWTSTLDVVEEQLRTKNIPCIRFDGTVSHNKRAVDIASFTNDPNVRVALLTISCGAFGLNLTAASRAYLMEPQWNPSVEHQALARIHRIGQTRPVTTIRYVMRGSLEEHVLNVQRTKHDLSLSLLSDSEPGTARDASRPEYLKAIM